MKSKPKKEEIWSWNLPAVSCCPFAERRLQLACSATKELLRACGYEDATESDIVAINGYSTKIGLAYHGSPSKNWGKT
jgi:hypothetical protein